MAKVTRRLQHQGKCHEIRSAVRCDGSSPAVEFLDHLAAGAWKAGLAAGDDVADQIDDADRFKALMVRFGSRGELAGEHQINGLGGGIWEFKVRTNRLSFFDTDGSGQYVSRNRFRTPEVSDRPNSKIWHIPNLERHLRLADGFPKPGTRAPASAIDWARTIRKEDLSHDK